MSRKTGKNWIRRFNVFIALTITALIFSAGFSTIRAEEIISIKKSDLDALIDERIEARMKELGLNTIDSFNARVEGGIRVYIENQKKAANAQVKGQAELARVVSKDEHIYGNPTAEFSVIEYSDYECPFCKRLHVSKTLNKLVDKYDGKVNWVYRHFPLGFHNPNAQKQAEAAECAGELAGNEGFWKYSDEIYQRTNSNKSYATSRLLPLAVELGFDEAKFSECFDSGRHAETVKNDFTDGQTAGINGTPGNILRHNATGSSVAVSGAVPLQVLVKEIEALADSVGSRLN